MEIDFQPVGSFMLCIPFALPENDSIIKQTDANKKTLAPILEVVAVGPQCTIGQPGKFAYVSENARMANMLIKGKLYVLIQEISTYGFFSTKPDISDIHQTDETYVPDLTDYVKVDKMSQMKMNFEAPVRD